MRILALAALVASLPVVAAAQPSVPEGDWPSFRGRHASGVADGQHLPDTWDVEGGDNVLWTTAIPGLGHSSPVVWRTRVFVTSAISGDPDASVKPGLYGAGTSSTDRTSHRWSVYALDTRTGDLVWEALAAEAVPIDRRHLKNTYASSTPVTDGLRGGVLWLTRAPRLRHGWDARVVEGPGATRHGRV